MNLKANGHQLT